MQISVPNSIHVECSGGLFRASVSWGRRARPWARSLSPHGDGRSRRTRLYSRSRRGQHAACFSPLHIHETTALFDQRHALCSVFRAARTCARCVRVRDLRCGPRVGRRARAHRAHGGRRSCGGVVRGTGTSADRAWFGQKRVGKKSTGAAVQCSRRGGSASTSCSKSQRRGCPAWRACSAHTRSLGRVGSGPA